MRKSYESDKYNFKIMSGYGMMIPGSKARSNLVSERPTEHGGKEVEHNMIKEAAEFADRAHQGVFRKGTEIPYITHPMETAAIVTAFTDEPEMIAAALLHDVIEDAGVTREELEEKFGPRVAFLVDGESEDKSKSWVERKGATVERLKTATRDEKILALADKLSNIRSTARDYLVLGDEVWQRFNQKDKEMQGWYYKGVAEALKEFKGHIYYEEYVMLCERVFG